LSAWRCLDAFAGSGALGFEAASRGAADVWLLERDATLVRALRQSAQRLHAANLHIECVDALAWMARAAAASFDLVLLDPPFGAGLGAPALAAALPLVAPGGRVYLEVDTALAEPPPGWCLLRVLRAGAVHAHLLGRDGPA
jgi:16S rRNA G966 N2-methylase RsmD